MEDKIKSIMANALKNIAKDQDTDKKNIQLVLSADGEDVFYNGWNDYLPIKEENNLKQYGIVKLIGVIDNSLFSSFGVKDAIVKTISRLSDENNMNIENAKLVVLEYSDGSISDIVITLYNGVKYVKQIEFSEILK